MSPSTATSKAGGGRKSGQYRMPQSQVQQQLRAQQAADDDDAAMDALDDAMVCDDEEGGTRIGDIYIPPPIPPHCSMESTGPRLIIKKIVNRNFKSYANEVTLGPFHQSFTAIIGPNGSGKSNVIDSMMFVFGCRANRIRCKRVSTLIHKSSRFPDLRSCSVAVHFEQIVDKGDGTCQTVPGSEIAVERTAMSDNSSYYQINGRRAQVKDVVKLLKTHHVDLEHNRFLILQGEVESIAMMKPKGLTENETGMLEYLEDIVGTQRYKQPLDQINQRVDQLTDDRTEKHNRCKLAERDMKDLEQPFNEAVEYLKKENDLVRTKSWVYQKSISLKKISLAEHTKEHEKCAEKLKTHDEATNALKQERAEKEEIIRKEIEAFEALVKQRDQVKKKLVSAERACTEVQSTMENTNKQRKKDKAQIEKNEKELEDLRTLPERNQVEIAECNKKLERLEKDKVALNEELEKQLQELKQKTEPLTEQRLKLSDELVGLKEQVNSCKAALQVHESELRMLKQVETTETRKYESLMSSYQQSQQNLDEMVGKVAQLKQGIPEMKSEIASKSAEVEKLTKEERNLSTKCTKLRDEINERSRNMQFQQSNNRVLDFLMRQKMEGKIPGILGRLGNLGGIDAKYDVAISTAAGGRLDNIVTENFDTASMCIAALKKHNVGRATFISLENIKDLKADSCTTINTPENVARLYDLVKVEDDRVRVAFYFALRNTLVATDLEQGTRIAYGRQRYRVVTLRGDMIELTGTMSGGGKTVIRGKMGTQVQTKTAESADSSTSQTAALEDMQIQAEELQTRINYCQEQQGRLEREVQTLQQTVQRNEAEYKRLEVSITSLEQQMASNLKQCDMQRQKMLKKTTDEDAVKLLEEQIETAKQELEQAVFAEQAMSSQIEEIQGQYTALRNDNVKPVEAKIKKTATQIEKLSANIRSMNVALSTAERNIEKITENNNNLRENIKTAEEKLRALSDQRQRFQEHKEDLEKAAEEAAEAIDNAKSQSSDLKKQIDELSKQENQRNIDRIEMEAKVQSVKGIIDRMVNVEIPGYQAKLKPLKLNDIPGETEPLMPLKELTEDELNAEALSDMQYKETVLEEQLQKKPNLNCIKDFNEKRNVYLDRVRVLEDITSKRNEMRDKFEEVRKRRYKEFMDGFGIITHKLKEMYQMITQGGDAELELVDSMDPFTEGVNFTVRPPKKSWKYISNLSGGEKTLSSLALVFALHYYKPSPLYFMDEIDAALDFKNVSIVAHYIKERTKNAQFIIVSLRVNMFELANHLVGIYKVNDCTQNITMLNKPPQLPEQPPRMACTMGATIASNLNAEENTTCMENTIIPRTNSNIENPLEEEQQQEKQLSTVGPGRDTTFAPPVESTAMSQAIQEANATGRLTTNMSLESPPNSPPQA
ncbi:structural maintenance of chromosomes protein 4 [Drosophila guanche]|uniref:Structural maintenance of chromosomes protein n=1 Tax=Drosophila guanche TaxID=7266 RepID=A0A3B0JJ69_DROGU|nr:structural maintenance of chromosomes protein 4 [Drosophila guanche]SPP82285.1 blast:Structural maintenance of chromosomes protein 4 [Drosophila guanche]